MKSGDNDQCHEGYSGDRSNYKLYDDYSILEPSPDIELQFLEDDDDELSDYSLMNNANVPDYEE
jgi:hypothetical protein